jgi:hypothetical protein
MSFFVFLLKKAKKHIPGPVFWHFSVDLAIPLGRKINLLNECYEPKKGSYF